MQLQHDQSWMTNENSSSSGDHAAAASSFVQLQHDWVLLAYIHQNPLSSGYAIYVMHVCASNNAIAAIMHVTDV